MQVRVLPGVVDSILTQKCINDKTTAIVITTAPQVRQDLFVRAAGFIQGVGEDGEAPVVESPGGADTLLVCDLGETLHGGVVPRQHGRRESVRGEAIADDLADHVAEGHTLDLGSLLDHPQRCFGRIGLHHFADQVQNCLDIFGFHLPVHGACIL